MHKKMIIKCRICLCENADKDICSLPKDIGVEKSPADVLLFSLGIQLSNKSKITTKLCSKCHKQIQKYYKFKLLAQESNSYLESLNLENEWNDSNLQEYYQIDNVKPENVDDNWDEENTSELLAQESNSHLESLILENYDGNNPKLQSLNFKTEIDCIDEVEDKTEEYSKYTEPEKNYENRDKENTIELTSIKEEQQEPCISSLESEHLIAVYKKKKKKKEYTKREKSKILLFCEPCGKTFSSKSCMQVHQGKFHSDSNAKRFQCDACEQSFFRKCDLQRHIDKLHMEWRCRICNLLLTNRDGYLKHTKSHQDANIEKAHLKVCPICGKLISHLNLHLATHRGVVYPCKGCDKKYRSLAARARHYKTVHEGLIYHCDICNKDVTCLLQHNKFFHKREGLKHVCDICGYRAISSSSLRIHLATHVVPHLPCPKCPKLFKDEDRLKVHSRQCHDKELRHMCPKCPKGFFSKTDLTNHMATHTSKRPFLCDHCYEPFRIRKHLVNHLRIKHKN